MVFDAPVLQILAPLVFVVGAIYVLGPTLPIQRAPWARTAVFVTVWALVLRYLDWRLFVTVLPADGPWYEVAWVYSLFAVEILAFGDAFILYLAFLRRSDNTPAADAHAARLRATSPEELPSVDVFITTYNEPFDVLEKTITGALALEYSNFKVWVLDDGRRAWLKEYCEQRGVGFINRPDNAHAKAGNINHGLNKTSGDYVALFDADFIPQRNFLMRTMGFFADPHVGIVQVPHTFYNPDPMQTNLAVRKALPDDQRFFFEAIMPSRDAWDAAFCCGSNSVTRRDALREVGDALPTESITEDQLLTLRLLREGYVTRYLCEPLAYGLAPEGVDAFFIQRRRWARGAMQILYLETGPLGDGLTLMQRLLFLPTHWLTQSLTYFLAPLIPLVFLWTGVLPMVNVTVEGVVFYILPTILATVGGICLYAPKEYFPLAVQVLGMFQSFKLLPTVLVTLVKPFGHAFKVTPKGSSVRSLTYDRQVFWTATTLIVLTVLGVGINLVPEWRVIQQGALIPVVAGWSGYNIVVLFLVAMMSLQGTARRSEVRFDYDEPTLIIGPGSSRTLGRVDNLSLTGAGVRVDDADFFSTAEAVNLLISEVGFVPSRIVRRHDDMIGLAFDLTAGTERDLLVRKLFTSGRITAPVTASALSATWALLKSVWTAPTAIALPPSEASASLAETTLPARSLVVPAGKVGHDWDRIVEERRAVA